MLSRYPEFGRFCSVDFKGFQQKSWAKQYNGKISVYLCNRSANPKKAGHYWIFHNDGYLSIRSFGSRIFKSYTFTNSSQIQVRCKLIIRCHKQTLV